MLATWKESYDKPRQHIKKHTSLYQQSSHIVKAMVFPVMYRCESWTMKVEHRRIDGFRTVMLEKTLQSSLDCKEIQSILKEINPEYLLEGLMLKLKLEYFGHLIRRANSLGKILMLGKTEDRRRRRGQDEMVGWHHQLNGHGFEQASGDSEGQGSLLCCRPCVAKVRHKWATEQVILNFNSQSMFSAMFYYLSKPC